MYLLGVKNDFSAAHFLKGYDGKCSNLHGHNWIVEAVFKGEKLNDIYLSVDFNCLKKILKDVLENLDHKNLNDIKEFSDTNPSAEIISGYIYNKLEILIKRDNLSVSVYEVKVWESDKTWVSYRN